MWEKGRGEASRGVYDTVAQLLGVCHGLKRRELKILRYGILHSEYGGRNVERMN
jgi:hypothetical protein